MHCYPQMLTACEIYLHNFVQEEVFLRKLYDKSLIDWSLGKQLILFFLELRLSGNKIKTESIIMPGADYAPDYTLLMFIILKGVDNIYFYHL